MKIHYLLLTILFAANSIFSALAQKPITIAKTNATEKLLIGNGDLSNFYSRNRDKVKFGKMKVVNAGAAYFLLADVQNANEIYAFELKKQGKKLRLVVHDVVIHSCVFEEKPALDLSVFLHKNGKISGCAGGNHSIRMRQN